MSKAEQRREAISRAMNAIRRDLANGPTVENLTAGKAHLIELAAQSDLFTFEDFPLPTDDAMECSYLIHEADDGSYALYVNSGAPHQYYAPHDHGDAWAIIAGVQGKEQHKLYVRRNPDDPGEGPILKKAEIVVGAGSAVTMTPDGIHEVSVEGGEPLLHLHLYAKNFVLQGERWKYDPVTGTAEQFHLDELGSITDAR